MEPIIWNERTGNVVAATNASRCCSEKGEEEIEAVVVDLDERDEKILNVLLNKVKGRWDIGKLADLLQELDEAGAMEVTGFEDWELQSLLMQYDHIKDLMEEDFSGYGRRERAQHLYHDVQPPGGSAGDGRGVHENRRECESGAGDGHHQQG